MIRIEFQARGSPHAHTLLWLKDAPVYANDPDEGVIAFINKISDMCFTLRPTITRACKITNTCTHQLVFDMEHVDLEFPSHHLLVH